MHYLLIVKEADYPSKDELEHLLNGFMAVFDGEKVGEYGVWEPWPYENFEEYKYEENIEEDDEEYTMEEVINGTERYRIGEDNEVYEKVSIEYDYYNVIEVATYADILKKYEEVDAFVENGEFDYTKAMNGDRDCPFADNERVYAIDCHI